MAKYSGIERGKSLSVDSIEAALDSKMNLAGDEEISGEKIFAVSPVIPEKAEEAGDNPTVIAAEAQVYKMENTVIGNINTLESSWRESVERLEDSIKEQIDEIISNHKTNVDDLLKDKVSLTGDEEISGTKTFTTSPLAPEKVTPVTAENKTVLATEAQVYKTIMCW
ncbi:hypothetical protein NO1_0900 [Candidatus Termititenax aidoneus]|uniref:Uncharacterized protein n=1 Tax=Termititenax aidoneus TaxID=2218524 RepID=A0A388TBF2_TERA1|nr:hypothetical protein NO1_0900 [Candidatus Termititenax aidoneus]